MKLTLVSSSLTSGGAERVLTLLTQGFLKKGHQVNVITLSGTETDFYQLPVEVNRLALNILGRSPNILQAVNNNLHRLIRLRTAIQTTQPDAVITFVDRTNVLTLLSLINTKYPVFVTEHCDPEMNYCGKVWDKLRQITYPYAAKVVSVSQGIDNAFAWLPPTKRAVIYNPLVLIEAAPPQIPPAINFEKNLIVSMGRLTYQKGFDILLTAFAKLVSKYPDWQLIILGEGELRQELENLKHQLDLIDKVIFTGAISNPFPILKTAEFFVMASRFEGFPMAHGEAMACGLPVISTDCPSGPREIIRDRIDGILVPNEDVSALAAAMEALMSDQQQRKLLATRAPEVTQRFSLEKVMEMWETLIHQTK